MLYATLALTRISLAGNPIVTFVIVGVLVAFALYFIPTVIPMDAKTWQIVRIVVIIALVLWALTIFGIL